MTTHLIVLKQLPSIRVALSSDESVEDADKIAVFSDSKSNLDTNHARIAESIDEKQLFDAIQDYPTKIDFFHIKNHRDKNGKNNFVDTECNVEKNRHNA